MLWRTGFLSQPLTRLRIHIPSLSFETVVWMISSRCVLELKYGKARIPVFFSHQAFTRRMLPLMTAAPCLLVSDTVSWIFWQNFHLPVLMARAGILLCSICIMPITQLCPAWLEGIKECGIGLLYIHTSCFYLLYYQSENSWHQDAFPSSAQHISDESMSVPRLCCPKSLAGVRFVVFCVHYALWTRFCQSTNNE